MGYLLTVKQYILLRILEWGIILGVVAELSRLSYYLYCKEVSKRVSNIKTEEL